MILIKADYERRIDIPGVPAPVRRPVDIDQAITGFLKLRTLRIYQFDQGSVIDGHAEEDEVFIVVMAGSIELTMIVEPLENVSIPVTLSAPSVLQGSACAAYLPPHAAYKLVAGSDAKVAYARATPVGTRLPRVFSSLARQDFARNTVLLEETRYAEKLRIRLVLLDAQQSDLAFMPIHESEAMCECLLHITTMAPLATNVATATSDEAAPVWLQSSDTIAALPGERLTLNLVKGSTALALIVMAT